MNVHETEELLKRIKNTVDALNADQDLMLKDLPERVKKTMDAVEAAKKTIDKFETDYMEHYDAAYNRMHTKRCEISRKIQELTKDVKIDIPAVYKLDQWMQLADRLGNLSEVQMERVLKLAEVMK